MVLERHILSYPKTHTPNAFVTVPDDIKRIKLRLPCDKVNQDYLPFLTPVYRQ